jgi:hypothetical protein
MPGYARNVGGSSKSLVFSNDTQAYSEKFYGIYIDLQEGELLVNEVDNKSEIITIPEEEGSFNEEYQYWIWSGTKLKFYWDEAGNPSRLLMEVT